MDLGTVRLCGSCAEVMRALAAQDEIPVDAKEVAGEGPVSEVVHEPVNWAWTACAGCGRRIPERGSKSHGGRPHCPECFHALPAPPAPGGPASVNPDATSADGECDGCGRSVDGGGGGAVQGFRICLACLTTDEALALELARARHRRRLVALRAQFPG